MYVLASYVHTHTTVFNCLGMGMCDQVHLYRLLLHFRSVGEKKLGRVACPDPWKSGARNTVCTCSTSLLHARNHHTGPSCTASVK